MPEEGISEEEKSTTLSPETPPGLSLADAAARLGRNEPDVRKLIALGRLKAEKVGNRWYVDPALKISKPTFIPQSSQQSPQGFSHLTPSSSTRDDPFFALRSLPEDSIIEIYRMRQGRRCYVVSMAPEEFSLRTVAQHWGGGAYLAIGIADGQITIERPFSVDGPEKHPDNPKDPPVSAPSPPIIPSADPQSLQLQQLAGQVQALQQALMAMAAGANNNNRQEDGENRKRWLEELILVKQALIPPPPPPAPPPPPQISPEENRKRWLEEIVILKQIFAQPPQQDSLAAVSTALMKGVEMAATVSSIGEKEGLGTALIKGMLPTISEVVGGIAKNLISPSPAVVIDEKTGPEMVVGLPPLSYSTGSIIPQKITRPHQIPTGTSPRPQNQEDRSPALPPDPDPDFSPAEPPSGTSPSSTPAEPPPSNGGNTDPHLLIPLLKRAARENLDPYPYAALIASEIPEEVAGQLRAATAEQFQHFAASLDPQLSEYPGWVGELRGALMAELEEEEGGESGDGKS